MKIISDIRISKIQKFNKKFMACYFCQRNIKEIDFKEINLLKKFLSGLLKIKPKRKTGLCASHQRKIAKAIKRARHLGLLPTTPK